MYESDFVVVKLLVTQSNLRDNAGDYQKQSKSFSTQTNNGALLSCRSLPCKLVTFPACARVGASHSSSFRFWLIRMLFWKTNKDVKFERVPSEDSEKLLPDMEGSSGVARPPLAVRNGVSWLVAAVMVTVTAVVSGLMGAWAAQQSHLDADAFSIRHTSQHCKYHALQVPRRALIKSSSNRRGCSYPLQRRAIQRLANEVQCLQAGFWGRGGRSLEVARRRLYVFLTLDRLKLPID
jgi:hypothetical protein